MESVRRWVRQADIDDGVRDGLTSSEQSELVQLRREKRRLEMENEILRRATAYYATLAERADAGLRGRDQRRWLRRLDHDSANLRRALDSACQRGDAALALRLVNATAWYLFLRGRLGEARRRVEQALAVDDGDSPAATARATAWRDSLRLLMGDPADPPTPPPRFDDIDDLSQRARAEWFLGFAKSDWGQITTSEALVARALASCEDHGDGWGRAAALSTGAKQAYIRGDLAAVAPDGEQSLALFRQLGDRWGQLQAMEWLGALAKLAGDYERATALHRDALRIAQALELWPQAADQMSWLGRIKLQLGDHEGAQALHEQARQLAAEHSYKPGETFAEIGLGCAARQAGDLDVAERALTNVVTGLARSNHQTGMTDAIVLTELGYIAELRGDATAARRLHVEALTAARTLGDHRALARALEGLAGAATLAGHHQRATRLLDRAAHTRALDGAQPSPTERSDIERIAAHARAALAEANVTAPPDSS